MDIVYTDWRGSRDGVDCLCHENSGWLALPGGKLNPRLCTAVRGNRAWYGISLTTPLALLRETAWIGLTVPRVLCLWHGSAFGAG